MAQKLEQITANQETNISTKPSFYDFTRKSVVGAIYRVGASFTMDAIYLTTLGVLSYYASEHSANSGDMLSEAKNFITNLDAGKLARVTAFVVAINFADYRFNITDRLDSGAKSIGKLFKK